MHSSGSVLRTVCEKTRFYIDDPDLDSKYDDDYLVAFVMPPVMEEVLSRVNMMADNPIRLRHNVDVVKGQETYILPPCVRQIYRYSVLDDQGHTIEEALPRGEFNPRGPGWAIEGNELTIRPFPQASRTVSISYIPSGEVHPVFASTGGGLAVDKKTFTFSATPGDVVRGAHDKRVNAYAGSFLRLLNGTNGEVEERIISDHTVGTGVTTRTVFDNQPTGDALRQYEVVPFLMETMMDAISLRMAMKAGVARKISQTHQLAIAVEYRAAIKTVYDNLANLQGRLPDMFDGDTVDVDAYRRPTSLLGN